ncbi:hypothetical protein GO755_00935 [Spirosoma sp. HMF4905]|uniref:Uncharacterized protein n=1 Tax=Spirosoma arboris TaxID=2682092 RepID=A0A7K1S4N3_9BACT|nr:hypothetical protein [Spirosoma arboris]MVM28576.1 hypothetical protein [Spirosoma arboris]
MERRLNQNDPQLLDYSTEATVLTNWLEATSTFYIHYNQLAPFASKEYTQKDLHSFKRPIPVNQLRSLLSKMKHELAKLLLDLDLTQTHNLACTKGKYKQLIAHTRILNRLNQEAEAMSFLAQPIKG